MSEKKATATAADVDVDLLIGLVDLLHKDIRDCRHVQLADGIRALAAERDEARESMAHLRMCCTEAGHSTFDAWIDAIEQRAERAEAERDVASNMMAAYKESWMLDMARAEKAEVEVERLAAELENVYSEVPCDKCKLPVTPGCYGCLWLKAQAEVERLKARPLGDAEVGCEILRVEVERLRGLVKEAVHFMPLFRALCDADGRNEAEQEIDYWLARVEDV